MCTLLFRWLPQPICSQLLLWRSWSFLFPLPTFVLYLPLLWMLPCPNVTRNTLTPPQGLATFRQKNLDGISTAASVSALLESADNEVSRNRLLATMTKESGAWIQALPITSQGLRMDNTTLRIAIWLRLWIGICAAHLCNHCGVEVDSPGTHGLKCWHSEERFHRRAYINDINH